MMKEELWSLAQDIVDEVNGYEMIKYERYEVSMAVARLVNDIEYAEEFNDISILEPYLETLEMTGNDELIGKLKNIMFDIMLNIMHLKVMEG